jgi:hypothetical protein
MSKYDELKGFFLSKYDDFGDFNSHNPLEPR